MKRSWPGQEEGEIRGWNNGDWGKSVKVDAALDSQSETDFDTLLLPGGQINPALIWALAKQSLAT